MAPKRRRAPLQSGVVEVYICIYSHQSGRGPSGPKAMEAPVPMRQRPVSQTSQSGGGLGLRCNGSTRTLAAVGRGPPPLGATWGPSLCCKYSHSSRTPESPAALGHGPPQLWGHRGPYRFAPPPRFGNIQAPTAIVRGPCRFATTEAPALWGKSLRCFGTTGAPAVLR